MDKKVDRVTVVCYGKSEEWDDRKEAIRFYAEGVAMCDGSEKERYANILADLVLGCKVATDK